MYALLRVKSVRNVMVAQLISLSGDLLAMLAVFSRVTFGLHGSASQATGVMAAYLLPQVFVGTLAGVLVDRWDVRATMIASDLIRAVLVLWLVWSSGIAEIYVVMTLLSAISAFFLPSQTILLRTIVPARELMTANGIMLQIVQITQIVIPGLAGLLVSRVGPAACFWLDSASFLFSAAMIARIPGAAGKTPAGKQTPLSDLRFGAWFIFTHPALAFSIVAMAAGSFAAACYSALVPTYVRDVLQQAASLFGLLTTLVGVGAVIGTYALTRLQERIRKERLITAGLLSAGAAILLLGVSGSGWAASAEAIGTGFAWALIITPAQTLIQSETPVKILGRIYGSVRSVVALVQIAGLILSGSVAARVGIRGSFVAIAAAISLIAAAQPQSFSRSTRR